MAAESSNEMLAAAGSCVTGSRAMRQPRLQNSPRRCRGLAGVAGPTTVSAHAFESEPGSDGSRKPGCTADWHMESRLVLRCVDLDAPPAISAPLSSEGERNRATHRWMKCSLSSLEQNGCGCSPNPARQGKKEQTK
jgi:hypothetical protein